MPEPTTSGLTDGEWLAIHRMADEAEELRTGGRVVNVFDFFSGTGSSTAAFSHAGHTIRTFELDPAFDATETVSILDLDAEYLTRIYGRPDFVWASPPCTAFSVASIGHHWGGGHRQYLPKTDAARDNQELVAHTVRLIAGLQPRYGWLMENPRGVLRKLPAVRGLPRSTVWYCRYGDERAKPTDLWGGIEGWLPSRSCRNGASDHAAAPRGAKTGTQGRGGARDRSMVPYGLSYEVALRVFGASKGVSEVAA